ncbi:MAG: hypothetical protein DHS20C07_31320 [Methyloligella sp.]|nr:MAG: hypothetical protein DHS20C07_31320 [Methyloligella sp.]
MNVKLTPKQTAILKDVIRLKLLSTQQIKQLHFKDGSQDSAGNMMRKLKMAKCVNCSYAPLNSTETKIVTRPTAIWYVGPHELKQISKMLIEQGRASEWEEIEATTYSINKQQRFAEQSLRHEIGISDALIALEKINNVPGFELVFALRTSPKHEDITQTIDVTKTKTVSDFKTKQTIEREVKQRIPINPDMFACIKNPDKTFSFYFVEYDNDSSKEQKFFEKLEGYFVYQTRGLFEPVARIFAERYAIPIKDFSRSSFRVLSLVNSHKNTLRRRNALFVRSLPLPTERFYNFSTIDDWCQNPLGQIFLNKKTFAPLMDEYQSRIKPATRITANKWFDINLDTLTKDTITQ